MLYITGEVMAPEPIMAGRSCMQFDQTTAMPGDPTCCGNTRTSVPTASGRVGTNPVLPTAALGYQQELYAEINPSRQSHVTLRDGLRSGTFDIRNVTAAGGQSQSLRITGSWNCSSMMHFTSKV